MASLDDPGGRLLLEEQVHAVVPTSDEDGTVHSPVVRVDVVGGSSGRAVAVDSVDSHPFRTEGEQRISLLAPTRVRHQKQR